MSAAHSSTTHMRSAAPGVVYWFRNDLRLHDAPGLQAAMALAERLGGWLLPVHVHDEAWHAPTAWGFVRTGPHRLAWQRMAVQGLEAGLQRLGSRLLSWRGDPVASLRTLLDALGEPLLVCEEIAAPYEQAQLAQLRAQGVPVHSVWQSTLIAPQALPFAPEHVPDTFTPFRQLLERHGVRASAPLPAPDALPPLPSPALWQAAEHALSPHAQRLPDGPAAPDPRSAFPWHLPEFHGGEAAALAHLARYCERGLPHSYKATRNGLLGVDFSSKWSPWLATGALSPRTAWAAVEAFEQTHGASESSYWLFFELLWRDHFRWLHRKHGLRLYRARGLGQASAPLHKPQAFARWCRVACRGRMVRGAADRLRRLQQPGQLALPERPRDRPATQPAIQHPPAGADFRPRRPLPSEVERLRVGRARATFGRLRAGSQGSAPRGPAGPRGSWSAPWRPQPHA